MTFVARPADPEEAYQIGFEVFRICQVIEKLDEGHFPDSDRTHVSIEDHMWWGK